VAAGNRALAMGDGPTASAEDSIAIGTNADANGVNGVAIGDSAAGAVNAIGIGVGVSAVGPSSVAIGRLAVSTVGDEVVIGTQAKSENSFNGIAIGQNAYAGDASDPIEDLIAIGRGAVATDNDGNSFGSVIAIGSGAWAQAQHSISIGGSNFVAGKYSMIFGNTSAQPGFTDENNDNSVRFQAKGGMLLPRGTTAERDSNITSPEGGYLRYNTSLNLLEFHNGSAWGTLDTGAGGDPNQNAFSIIDPGDGNPATADNATDTLNLVGGTNVTLTGTPATNTITIDAAASGEANQNAWSIIQGNGTSVNAAIPTDSINLIPGANMQSIVADDVLKTLTFNVDNFPADQNLFSSVFSDLTEIPAASPTDSLTLIGGANITLTPVGSQITIDASTSGEVNQNAFAHVTVDGLQAGVDATVPEDTMDLVGGTGITLTPTGASNRVTISTPAEANQNAYADIQADGATNPAADPSDAFNFIAGAEITLTPGVNSMTISATAGGDPAFVSESAPNVLPVATGVDALAMGDGSTEDQDSSASMNGLTGALTLPGGTEAQIPATPRNGMFRWNSDNAAGQQLEFYDGTNWYVLTMTLKGGPVSIPAAPTNLVASGAPLLPQALNIQTEYVTTSVTATHAGYVPSAGTVKLVVCVGIENPTPQAVSVTYNGNNLTKRETSLLGANEATVWDIDDPLALAASGDIVVTTNGTTAEVGLTAMSLLNVQAGAPEDQGNASISNGTQVVASVAPLTVDAFVVSAFSVGDAPQTITADVPLSELHPNSVGPSAQRGAGSYLATATGAQSVSWTSSGVINRMTQAVVVYGKA
jgi:hypothetical protein